MKRVIIFANGRMGTPPSVLAELQNTDLVIAVDGGTHLCISLGITPQLIIGDFDSLEPLDVAHYQSLGVETIQYPTHKDDTDLELALTWASEHDADQVYIIGGLGARPDMTFSNVMLAAHSKFSHLSIRFVDGKQTLAIVRGKTQFTIDDREGDLLSLIPISGDVHGITTYGLEYPLSNETLFFGSSRGVSNVVLDAHAWVSIENGILLCCILDRMIS